MKKGKKLLSLILSLLLVSGTLALAVSSANADTGYSAGDIIQFGTYPQTGVAEDALLKAAARAAEWKSFGYYSGDGGWSNGNMAPGDYMKYADFTIEETRYRVVSFTALRPRATGLKSNADSSYQDDNQYAVNTNYYFRFDPIEWRVLDPESGLVMCTSAIDSQAYNNYVLTAGREKWGDAGKNYYASNYENSSIRQWLLTDFYNTAFSVDQKDNIGFSGSLDNKSTFSAAYDSAATNDKVFLLSYSDVTNSSYGFNPSADADDPLRSIAPTDYARCQGIYRYGESPRSYCWLRTPGSNGDFAGVIDYRSHACLNDYVYLTSTGVAPAIKLKTIKSDTSPAPDYSEAELGITAENITYGETATVTVTLPGDATGMVYINIDGSPEIIECNVLNGTASCEIDGIPGGSHTVHAFYDGNGKYASTEIKATIKASKIEPDVGVFVAEENPVYGQAVTIKLFVPADVPAAGKTWGTLTVKDSGGNTAKTITVSGTALEYQAADLAAGDYTVIFDFSGDESYNAGSANTSFTVGKATPELTVTAGDIACGESQTITVACSAPGEVKVDVDSNSTALTLSANGEGGYEAELEIDSPETGEHSYTVSYIENKNFNAVEKTGSFTVHSTDCTLKITYVYAKGGTAHDDYIATVTYGNGYEVESPAIPGYSPDPAVVSGTMNSFDGVSVTVTYTPVQYTATFVGENDKQVAQIPFTVETEQIDEPAVPEKEGFDGSWEAYEIGAGDLIIHAVYTEKDTGEDLCPLDGKNHGDKLIGKVIKFIHTVIWKFFRIFKLNVKFRIN